MQNPELAELGRLMGLTPGTKFELARIEVPFLEEYDKYDTKVLGEEAILGRPELYQEDMEEHISQDGVRLAITKMLPSPALILRHDWDNNPHLYANYWYTLGLKATWQLLSIPEHISAWKAEKLRLLLRLKRKRN